MSECSICLDDINKENTTARTLKCYHTFHQDCIRKWFSTSNNTLCPNCKHDEKKPVGEHYQDDENNTFSELNIDVIQSERRILFSRDELNIIINNLPDEYIWLRRILFLIKSILSLSCVCFMIYNDVGGATNICYSNGSESVILYKCNTEIRLAIFTYIAQAIAYYFIIYCLYGDNISFIRNCRNIWTPVMLFIGVFGLMYVYISILVGGGCCDYSCDIDVSYCKRCFYVINSPSNKLYRYILITLTVEQCFTIIIMSCMIHIIKKRTSIRDHLLQRLIYH